MFIHAIFKLVCDSLNQLCWTSNIAASIKFPEKLAFPGLCFFIRHLGKELIIVIRDRLSLVFCSKVE